MVFGKYTPKSVDIWALGITVVIGGQYFGWNFGLVAGFGSFLIALTLVGTAYICLIFSLAEITSALPFSGGSFALVRCMVGFYPGFVIGCCESLEYVFYVATSAIFLARTLITLLNLDRSMQPILCLLFYVSAITIYIKGGSVFWIINMILALLSVGFILIYSFGSFQYDRIKQNARFNDDTYYSSSPWFIGGFSTFAQIFPLTTWYYVGVESLSFANDYVENPKRNVPRGYVACVLTLFFTSILVLFSCVSQSPGIVTIASLENPLTPGFSRMFGINDNQTILLMLPAIYATAFGFIFGYGKIFHAMSSSNLLPWFLKYHTPNNRTPYAGIIFGSVIGQCLCTTAYFYPMMLLYLFNICIFNGFLTYIAQCTVYYKLNTKFRDIPRDFKSPFGIYGAFYAIIIFSFGLFTIIGFQKDDGIAAVSMTCFVICLSIYYFIYLKSKQIFSDEEIKLAMNDLVAKYNKKILNDIRHGNKKRRGSKVMEVLGNIFKTKKLDHKTDQRASNINNYGYNQNNKNNHNNNIMPKDILPNSLRSSDVKSLNHGIDMTTLSTKNTSHDANSGSVSKKGIWISPHVNFFSPSSTPTKIHPYSVNSMNVTPYDSCHLRLNQDGISNGYVVIQTKVVEMIDNRDEKVDICSIDSV